MMKFGAKESDQNQKFTMKGNFKRITLYYLGFNEQGLTIFIQVRIK